MIIEGFQNVDWNRGVNSYIELADKRETKKVKMKTLQCFQSNDKYGQDNRNWITILNHLLKWQEIHFGKWTHRKIPHCKITYFQIFLSTTKFWKLCLPIILTTVSNINQDHCLSAACTGRTVIDQSIKHNYKKYKRLIKGYILYACCIEIKIELNMVPKTSRKYSIVFDKQQDTPSPWLTRIWLTRISLTRIFKRFPFLT